MQQACALGKVHIKAELVGHDTSQEANFDRVRQEVLSVRRAVLHAADIANHLWMDVVNTKLHEGVLTNTNDLFFEFLANLFNNLFDTCRVDTSIAHEALE